MIKVNQSLKYVQLLFLLSFFSSLLPMENQQPQQLNSEFVAKIARQTAEQVVKSQKNQSGWWFLPPWQVVLPTSVVGVGLICYRWWSLPRQLNALGKEVGDKLECEVGVLNQQVEKNFGEIEKQIETEKKSAENQTTALTALETQYSQDFEKRKKEVAELAKMLSSFNQEDLPQLEQLLKNAVNGYAASKKGALVLQVTDCRLMLNGLNEKQKAFLLEFTKKNEDDVNKVNQGLEALTALKKQKIKGLQNIVEQIDAVTQELNSSFEHNEKQLSTFSVDSANATQELSKYNSKAEKMLANNTLGDLIDQLMELSNEKANNQSAKSKAHDPVNLSLKPGKPMSAVTSFGGMTKNSQMPPSFPRKNSKEPEEKQLSPSAVKHSALLTLHGSGFGGGDGGKK